MTPDHTTVRESYGLTPDQVATALTETVLRAQIASAEDPDQGGVLGSLQRADRAVERVEGGIARLVFAGAPIALGVFLLAVAGKTTLGLLAIGAGVLALLFIRGLEGFSSWFDRRVDAATDPLVAGSGRRKIRAALEKGSVSTLNGEVEAELVGDRLVARSGALTVTIPSVRGAWRAQGSSHLVLAETAPGLRPDFSKCVVLPAGGDVAAAIAER
ncbi:MAG: hypothetical protein AAGA81_03845 [Acidobacteriota bacterium]